MGRSYVGVAFSSQVGGGIMAENQNPQSQAKPQAKPDSNVPTTQDLLKRLEAVEANQKIENPPDRDEQDPTYAEQSLASKVSLYAEDLRDGESQTEYKAR